jgi:hypothetical protein
MGFLITHFQLLITKDNLAAVFFFFTSAMFVTARFNSPEYFYRPGLFWHASCL